MKSLLFSLLPFLFTLSAHADPACDVANQRLAAAQADLSGKQAQYLQILAAYQSNQAFGPMLIQSQLAVSAAANAVTAAQAQKDRFCSCAEATQKVAEAQAFLNQWSVIAMNPAAICGTSAPLCVQQVIINVQQGQANLAQAQEQQRRSCRNFDQPDHGHDGGGHGPGPWGGPHR